MSSINNCKTKSPTIYNALNPILLDVRGCIRKKIWLLIEFIRLFSQIWLHNSYDFLHNTTGTQNMTIILWLRQEKQGYEVKMQWLKVKFELKWRDRIEKERESRILPQNSIGRSIWKVEQNGGEEKEKEKRV